MSSKGMEASGSVPSKSDVPGIIVIDVRKEYVAIKFVCACIMCLENAILCQNVLCINGWRNMKYETGSG